MQATDPAQLAGLSLLLRAPSKDAVAAVFAALFAQRHGAEAARAAAVGALLALSADEAPALASAAGALLRRALYESSELPTLEAVRALVPAELDGRLASLVAGVRRCAAALPLPRLLHHHTHSLSAAPCAHPCNTLPLLRAPLSLSLLRCCTLACPAGARRQWGSAWACRSWRACPGACWQ